MKKFLLIISSLLLSAQAFSAVFKINSERKSKKLLDILKDEKVVKTETSSTTGRTGGGGNVGP